jgi:hypothetical protein
MLVSSRVSNFKKNDENLEEAVAFVASMVVTALSYPDPHWSEAIGN